jgi:succinate dehydrogenase / fumarate reductase, cytochrome b subunit
MNWKQYFSTSIGKKLIMALTGIFLIVFLVVHCYINAQIFYNDGGVRFNEAAHFMGTNFVIRIVEIGLFALLVWHMVLGLALYNKNKGRRGAYAVSAGNKTSKWYSRSMALLGTLILIFLIIHLRNFWAPNRLSTLTGGEELPLYNMMKEQFQQVWLLAIYLLGVFSLGWHLLHGFYSAFQTLGLCNSKYKGLIKTVGVAFSIIVPLAFASMPVAFFLHLLN